MNSGQVTAVIPASDLLVATSTAQITVTNAAPGGGTSNAQTFSISNPVPTTTSISPTSKNVGDAQFTLTVNGTNFVSGSTVQVNGSDRTTIYASSTELTATILSSDLLSSSTLAITVSNSSPGGGVSNSQYLYVSPAAIVPTKFIITNATNGTIDLASLVTIQAQDNSGELADTYGQDVTLLTSGSASGGGLINIINGIGTTTVSDTVAENVHLSLQDSAGTGLNVSSTKDISFGPGETEDLSITTGSTTEIVAGNRLPIAITRQDRLGNLVTNGSETFYLYSNSLSPANKFYDASNGGNIVTTILIPNNSSSATVWYYDEKVGNPQITASDNSSSPDGATGINDASVNITVDSAPAATLLINNPGDLIAGQRLNYELSRQDQFGNPSNNGALTVYLYDTSASSSTVFYDASSGGNIINSLTMSSGTATSSFWLYGEHSGNLSVTASDNSSSPDGATGINDSSVNLSIDPGPTAVLSLNNPGDMTVGTRLGYTVSRYDAFNNSVNSGDLNVYLYNNASGTTTVFYDSATVGNLISSITISNGSQSNNFWLYSGDTGNYTITASDNSSSPDGSTGINDGTDIVEVTAVPIVATRFVISDPTPTTVGTTTTITIQAKDTAGNIDASYNNAVTLHTSGNATPGGIVNIVNGIGTINILDTKAENVSLTLEDTSSTNLDVTSSKIVTFLPGPTAKFSISGANNSSAGDRIDYTISRQDQYGNQISTGVDTVYLYSNAPSGTADFYDSSTGGSQILSTSITNGSPSTDIWFAGIRAGNWMIDTSDNSSNPDGGLGIIDATSTINIIPASTARLVLDDPGDMFNGTRLGYIGTRYDAYNNLVTAGSSNYYLYSNSNGTSTAFYSAATGGSPITTLNFANGQSTANFWYYENNNGIWTVYLSDNSNHPDGSTGIVDGEDSVAVSAIPIAATKFIIVVANNSSLVGTPVAVTVRAVDNSNNIDSTYQNNVTLRASGSATGDGIINITNGVGQTLINDQSEEITNLTLQDTNSTGLDISSSQTINFIGTLAILSGGGGSGGSFTPKVSFTGKAFPNANVEVVAIQNGQIPVGNTSIGSTSGNFNIGYTGVLPSTANSFALVVYDKNKNVSQTKVFKLGTNAQLTSSILLSPTVSLKQQAVTKGTFMGITGSAMPKYKIELIVDGVKAPETATSLNDGSYDLNFNTYRLDLGRHTLKVRQVDSQGNASDYSIEKNFLVTRSFVPKADLNGDGKVDIADWGIFMARYRSADPKSRQSLDLNNDGKVDSKDLSQFLDALGNH